MTLAAHLVWAAVALVATYTVWMIATDWIVRVAKPRAEFAERIAKLETDFAEAVRSRAEDVEALAAELAETKAKLSGLAERTDPSLQSRSAIGRR